jgi:hypothetical protein
VFDHFDLSAVGRQRGSAGNFDPVMNVCDYSPRRIEIATDKNDAAMRAGGTKLHLHVPSAPITEARHRARASKRSLVSQGFRQGCITSKVFVILAAGANSPSRASNSSHGWLASARVTN